MTTWIEKRCRHCRARYAYQGSGEGCNAPLNDNRHCPECRQIIIDALAAAPIRCELRWEPVTEPTVETLEGWSKKREAAAKKAGKLYGRRVVAPLFDMEDPSNHNVTGMLTGEDEYRGRLFRWSYWTKGNPPAEVHVAMERNLQSGEETYWKDL